jgi:hypothetical protein
MKNSFFLCLIGLLVFSACKKDDKNSSVTVASINSTVVSGNWRVTYYYDTDHEETSSFSGYSFVFGSNGVITATKGATVVTGAWSSGNDDSHVKLILAFSSPSSFAEISDDWHVIERTDTKIRLQDVSGGNGGTDYLTFERN